jgi:hypothetical protein
MFLGEIMKKILLLLAMLGYVGTVVPAALAAEKKKKKAAYSEDAGALEKAVGAEKVDAAAAEDDETWEESDDDFEPSPFQKAVYDGASKVELQDLVTKGAVVNELHANMGSTLMIPVVMRQPAVFTALLELGADPYQEIITPASGIKGSVADFIERGSADLGIQKAWQQWKDAQAAAARAVAPSVIP